jgi:methionine synthase I (cobalamin-dependent)
MSNKVQELLSSGKPVVLDGAMGTMLMDAGLKPGLAGEIWNITEPEKVRAVHRAYIEAGSQIVLTNTFGGTRIRMESHGDNDVFEINRAAAENVSVEADNADHLVLAAGSMGPTGQLMKPYGPLSFEAAVEAFAEQSKALAEGGADLLWIETMSDLNEAKAAYEGIREHSELPVAITMTFDTNGHTMMGVHPSKAVEELSKLDLVALGANCGTGPDEMEKAVKSMAEQESGIPIIVKSNAGLPYLDGSEVKYDGTPEVMASHAKEFSSLGAILIGGCCGTSPEHIKAMAEALRTA